MKVTIVSQADALGGSARAAYRLHRELAGHGVDSWMRVARRLTDDPNVVGPQSKLAQFGTWIRPRVGRIPTKLQHSPNPVLHSPAWVPSRISADPLLRSADVVNLHWTGHEFMSIADIGRIDRPVVWTLHDMWAFCGAEHLSHGPDDRRFSKGYTPKSRPQGHTGFDLDRWTYRRKCRAWTQPRVIVTPSRWLAECVQNSPLLGSWPVRVVPNPLPTNVFRPSDPALGRALFGLPQNGPLVLFGAVGGAGSTIKGADLLWPALRKLASISPNCRAVVVGQSQPRQMPDAGMPIHYVGHLSDDQSLALLYGAVDVVIIPSRIENLTQVGTESQSCATPVVAFNSAGLADVVRHQETGYLAQPFEVDDLAAGVAWILSNPERRRKLGENARTRAITSWSPEAVLPQYLDAFAEAQSLYQASRR